MNTNTYNRWLSTPESIVSREALIRQLRDVGANAIEHYQGVAAPHCPDARTPNRRRPGCPACDVLREADALLGDTETP